MPTAPSYIIYLRRDKNMQLSYLSAPLREYLPLLQILQLGPDWEPTGIDTTRTIPIFEHRLKVRWHPPEPDNTAEDLLFASPI